MEVGLLCAGVDAVELAVDVAALEAEGGFCGLGGGIIGAVGGLGEAIWGSGGCGGDEGVEVAGVIGVEVVG